MMVKVKIQLRSSVETSDREEMLSAAKTLTDIPDRITITQPKGEDRVLTASFIIPKARQIDVVDKIAQSFRDTMKNYDQPSISFPKDKETKKVRKTGNYTQKQGQYLAFIYYYSKIHGIAPSEADMQRYFKSSPPSVHSMVVKLEKNGLIERKANTPRSIKLLLSRSEIPDLE